MSLFALDTVRNARTSPQIEIVLEGVRARIASLPDASFGGPSRGDVLGAFDAARARLNITASQLRDLRGSRGADISTGLGFLPPVLRRLGLDVAATRNNRDEPFAAIDGPPPTTQYTLGEPSPFAEGSMAWVACTEVLEHVKMPPGQVIQHLARLLSDGGRLVLSTPNIARLAHLEALASGENFLESFDEDTPPGADPTDSIDHVREYSVREVVDAVENAGLGVDRVLMTGWGDAGYNLLPNPYANEIMVVVATK